MITKLVYVLTCAPDKTYIEQALMSMYSARHWNPDAHIVMITDDATDQSLTDSRGEILKYINEKIIVPFSNNESMMYRSRYIKTLVRELVKGDFLFIDCDTIVCKSLADIDKWSINVGAVYESHLKVSEFCDSLFKSAYEANKQVGVDLSQEEEYFSSGVLYVKDTPHAHKLYNLWHQNWLESQANDLFIDQPSLCKANIECGHIIKKIPDTYNTILFTRCSFTKEAHILHIASYRNPSFLFEENTLHYIRENGLQNQWLREVILDPCRSFRPFDINILNSSSWQRLKWITSIANDEKQYKKIIGCDCHEKSLTNVLKSFVWMIRRHGHTITHRSQISDNICKK